MIYISIYRQDDSEHFVVRFVLATSTKPMFEVRKDEFGRLLVHQRTNRTESGACLVYIDI